MSKVNILPPEIVAKIAAGEVIERPASVVKELIENSLDANATSIALHVLDAGKQSIKIVDNGHGIEQADLEKIFLRHATSKIQTSEDLFQIDSLGFRGEALYSVAAIADVRVKSKTADQSEAWEIHVRGGEQQSLKPAALNNSGTEIEIKELFFNTPARKKFLKQNSTEFRQILDVVMPYTLLYPHIRFQVSHQGKTILDVAPTQSLASRIAHVLNLKEEHLFQVEKKYLEKDIELKMVLGDINIKRTRRDMQYLFINDRPVFNKNMSYHMNAMYRLIMAEGEFPFFCVYLTIPAEDVDVNIHPTKREVKIKQERDICSLLRRATEDALMKKSSVRQFSNQTQTGFRPAKHFGATSTGFEATTSSSESLFQSSGTVNQDHAYPKNRDTSGFSSYIPENNLLDQESLHKKLENAKYIGGFIDKYLFFESGSNVLVMDQHAAAERVTYEKIIRHMQKGDIEVQPLLAPVLVSVTPQEMSVWEEAQDEFKKVGLESTSFDAQTIAIHSQPVLLKDTEKTVRHLLAGDKVSMRDHDQIARRACRSSIMTGDHLKPEQCEYLREELLQCLDPLTCPHGRPTVIEMTEDFLDQQFLRK